MIEVNLQGLSKMESVLRALSEAMSDKSSLKGDLASVAASVANEWYDDKADYFDNPNSPTHGAGRKDTGWAKKLAQGWIGESTESGFSVVFSPQDKLAAGSFLTHILGRTITAKKSFLTIPMQPEAHGLSTRLFESAKGVRLFRPRIKGGSKSDRKSYLAYSLGRGQGISVAYLLRKSVTIPSLKERTGREPLPTAPDFQNPLTTTARSHIERILKK